MGKMLVVIIGAVGELERDLIREGTEAGRQVARRRGVKLGRRPVVTPEVHDRIFALQRGGKRSPTSPICSGSESPPALERWP